MTGVHPDCARARAILWPTDRPRLAGDDVVEATGHVEACPECSRALSYDAALLTAFERIKSERPPRAVRERIHDVLARERARSGPSTGRRTGASSAPNAGPSTGPSSGPPIGPNSGTPTGRSSGPPTSRSSGPPTSPNSGTPSPSSGPPSPSSGPPTGPPRSAQLRHHLRRKVRVMVLGAMAAGVAITLIVTATVVARSGGPTEAGMAAEGARDAAAFIEDYMRRAVREDHIMTSDPRLVRQFLARELGLPIALITLEGFDIEGAEVCLLEGVRGAMVAYKRDGELLSYYVLPRRGGDPRAPALRTTERDPFEGATTAVTWATREAEYALVGTLPAATLLDAARNTVTASRP